MYVESDGEPETSSVKRKFAKPPAIHFPGTVATLSVMILTATTTLSIAMYNSTYLLIQCCQNPTSTPLYQPQMQAVVCHCLLQWQKQNVIACEL